MIKADKINFSEILQIQNLISLSRIVLTPFIGYLLWVNNDHATLIIVILLIVAGASDYLDGYLARRLNRQTALGLMLDPLADKIFATILIIELIFLRGFPVWLAAMVFIRDIIILLGASYMMKHKGLIPFSINSGKYYFAALALLIASYVIRFDFGQQVCLYLTILLFVVSSLEYARNFYLVKNGKEPKEFVDNRFYKSLRITFNLAFSAVYLYKLFEQFIGF